MRHRDRAIAEDAVEAIVRIGEPSIDGLINALENPTQAVTTVYDGGRDFSVNWPTAVPLTKIGKPAVEPLIQALKGYAKEGQPEGEHSVRAKRVGAALTLGHIGDKQAVQPLIESLRNEHSDSYHGAAIALGMIGDPQAVEPLLERLGHKDIDFAEEAPKEILQALGKFGDKRAVQPLTEILLDTSWGNVATAVYKRYWAIIALIDIKDETALEPLITILSDKIPFLRWSAAIALGKIGDERVVKPLIKALSDKVALHGISDKREYVCIEAAEALGNIGDETAVEALIKMLNEKRWEFRKAASMALGEIGDARAVDPLRQAMQDKRPDVREAAKEALNKLELLT